MNLEYTCYYIENSPALRARPSSYRVSAKTRKCQGIYLKLDKKSVKSGKYFLKTENCRKSGII